eukprot:gene684-8936_t
MQRTKLIFNRTKNELKKYPKVAVSAIPFLKVTKDDYEVLLVKRKNEPDKGLFSVPGGSIEYGEHTREAIERELYEETNITPNEYELSDTIEALDVIKKNEKNHEIIWHYVILQFTAIIKKEPLQIKPEKKFKISHTK